MHHCTSAICMMAHMLLQLLVSGGVTWMFELLGGHYIEFLKVMKQTKKGSYAQLTREMISQKGFIGIWDGFVPWGSIQASHFAV
jgi:hypothetical protein